MTLDRVEALSLLDEATKNGCRLVPACRELGLHPRTVQRWRGLGAEVEDRRRGPSRPPSHQLTAEERREVLEVATSVEFRNVSPKQIVPRLADRGVYLASESTFYRLLHVEGLMAHRSASRPRTVVRPEELVATGPNRVWSWDITYIPSPVRGKFYYLYLFLDVWSRRIMKAVVLEEESAEHAARLLHQACEEHGILPGTLFVHSDNGGPMKGATMLATMQNLGIVHSFSRPSVSNDNPYSESLFRTLKYGPSYPRKPFASLDAAWAWVERFVDWYNHRHLHSAIGFVTPDDRHHGRDVPKLLARRDVYEAARSRHPRRWARSSRRWDAPATVALNPILESTRARATSELRIGASSSTSMVPTNTSRRPTGRHRHHADEATAA